MTSVMRGKRVARLLLFQPAAEAHKGQIEPLIFRAFSCFLAVVKRVYRMA